MANQIEALLKEVERLQKINQALMSRVERSTARQGSSFSLFESNIALSTIVKERTKDLNESNLRLESERNLLSTIMEALPGTILVINSKMEVIRVFSNKNSRLTFNQLSKVSEGVGFEYQGKLKTVVETLIERSKEAESSGLIAKGSEFDFRISIGGDNRYVHSAVTKIPSQDQFVLYLQDITELKKTELDLLQAQSFAKIGSWKHNLVTGELIWSPENYQIFEIVGPQPANILFEQFIKKVHPEDWPLLEKLTKDALALKEGFVVDHRIILDNGRRVKYLKTVGEIEVDAKGNPVFISGTCQDLTEMREREIQLQEANEFNECIRRSARVLIITTYLDGTINSFNKESEEVLGYGASDVLEKTSITQFHEPRELEQFALAMAKEMKAPSIGPVDALLMKARDGQHEERQWNYLKKDGTSVPVMLKISGLYSSRGELHGFLFLAREISEQVKLQNQLELERAKSLHSSKLASLGEMSAGIAHEINNPLGIIQGNLLLLNRYKDDPEKVKAKIETAIKACKRIDKIVKGLKKFSRSSEINNVRKIENLNEIVNESLVITEVKSKRFSTPIFVELTGALTINCDAAEIEQVIINLVNNGIDAVKDLPEKWVRIIAFEKEDRVLLQVQDSGCGITAQIEEKLFNPFFTTKPVGEGTGLGLSITKGILDQHGATLRLNRSFQNTCFEIDFPKSTLSKAS